MLPVYTPTQTVEVSSNVRLFQTSVQTPNLILSICRALFALHLNITKYYRQVVQALDVCTVEKTHHCGNSHIRSVWPETDVEAKRVSDKTIAREGKVQDTISGASCFMCRMMRISASRYALDVAVWGLLTTYM